MVPRKTLAHRSARHAAYATLGLIAALFVSLALIAPGSSQAAVVPNAITAVSTSITPGGTVNTNLTWAVPDSAQPGDTFSLTLPGSLAGYPATFPLKNPDGDVVAIATVTGSPAVATFTLTDFVATHDNVHGTGTFSANVRANADTDVTLTYVNDSGTAFSSVVHTPAAVVVDRTKGRKTGRFTTSTDQCRTTTGDCIEWTLETPTGPLSSGTITDTATAGQTIDCDTLTASVGDASGTNAAFANGTAFSGYTVTCSPTSLSLSYGAVPSGKLLQFRFKASVTDPAAANGGYNFANTAKFTQIRNGTPTENGSTSYIVSASGSGNGDGDVPTTTPVVPTTPVAPTSPPTTPEQPVAPEQPVTPEQPTTPAQPTLPTPQPKPGAPKLTLKKTSNHTTVKAGSLVTYTLTARNTGTVDATDVALCDQLPDHLTLVRNQKGLRAAKLTRGQLCWSIGTLKAGQTAVRSFQVRIDSDAPRGTVVNHATVDRTNVAGTDAKAEHAVRVEQQVVKAASAVTG